MSFVSTPLRGFPLTAEARVSACSPPRGERGVCCTLTADMWAPCRDARRVRGVGGWRAEKRRILMARALRHAGASRRANRGRFRHRARFSPVRRASPRRPILQLAPGRTSYWVRGELQCRRASRCDETRRRRTSSRFTTPHDAPLSGRGERMISQLRRAGISVGKLATLSSSRRKAGIQGQQAPSQRLWIPAFAGMTESRFSSETISAPRR
jgi:hypothetical protein